MANHLTPTELAREAGLERREVIAKCMELGVPIFQGRIDKTLFLASLARPARPPADAAGHRLTTSPRVRRACGRCWHRIASSSSSRRRGLMEAGTAAQHDHGLEDDRRPAAAARREQYGDHVAVRHKVDGDWHDVTFAEVGEIVSEIGARPDRPRHRSRATASASSATRAPSGPTRDFAITAAGAVVVPIYPTNSPEECEWVAGNSEAVAVVCEDADAGREDRRGARRACPHLRHVVVIDPAGRRRPTRSPLDELRERGRGRDARRARRPRRGGRARRPLHVHLHLGHDRPAEGLRAHARQLPLACSTWSASAGCSDGDDDLVYLFLPLAHAFALLIQLGAFDLGATIAYFGGDTKQIIPELMRGPADLPAVGPAHLREALHAGLEPASAPEEIARRSARSAARSATSRSPASRSRPSCASTSSRSTKADRSVRSAVRRPPARGRHRRGADRARRSSSSSGAAACRCSRATG